MRKLAGRTMKTIAVKLWKSGHRPSPVLFAATHENSTFSGRQGINLGQPGSCIVQQPEKGRARRQGQSK